MPRLTNDIAIYQSEIKKLLTATPNNSKALWLYLEMTQILDYGYSLIFLLRNNSFSKRQLLLREWKYDSNSHSSFGLFNLNSIIIHEKELHITLNETYEVQVLRRKELEVLKTNTITLDGFHKEFIDFKYQNNYRWNTGEAMNPALIELITKLENIIKSFN